MADHMKQPPTDRMDGSDASKPASLPPTPPEPRTVRAINREPNARLVRDAKACTIWEVEVPMPTGKTTQRTKVYHATTYPNSDLIYLQSSERGRAIPTTSSTRLLPLVRAAIAAALAAPQPTGDTQ